VAFTYQKLKALGVPQDSLDSFAPEFRQGMAARAAHLGDTGDSGPGNWEKPLGRPEVHVAVSVLAPASLESVSREVSVSSTSAASQPTSADAGTALTTSIEVVALRRTTLVPVVSTHTSSRRNLSS